MAISRCVSSDSTAVPLPLQLIESYTFRISGICAHFPSIPLGYPWHRFKSRTAYPLLHFGTETPFMKKPKASTLVTTFIWTAPLFFTAPWVQDSRAEGRRTLASAPVSRVKRSLATLPSKTRTQTTEREIPIEKEQSGTGLGFYMGLGGGYLSVSSANPATEPNKAGASLIGRASVSFYNPRVTLDLGLGWLQSKIGGTSITQTATSSTRTDSSVLTRAGEIDFSPRLKLGSNFDLGPSAMVLLGTDSSFSDRVGGVNTPILLGAKGGFFWETQTFLFRATAQIMSSVGLQDRKAFLGSTQLEIGIPLVSGKTIVREREVHTIQDHFQRETVETEKTITQIEERDVIREVVQFSFDDQVIHFEFDRAELLSESREFTRNLGKFLAHHSDLWSSARIEGHTDSRGSDEYNLRLSDARADAIRRALIDSGVPAEKLASRGYGKQRPIDSRESDVSRARNRRVEISFTDVKDSRALRDEINRLRFASVRPNTCSGEQCR